MRNLFTMLALVFAFALVGTQATAQSANCKPNPNCKPGPDCKPADCVKMMAQCKKMEGSTAMAVADSKPKCSAAVQAKMAEAQSYDIKQVVETVLAGSDTASEPGADAKAEVAEKKSCQPKSCDRPCGSKKVAGEATKKTSKTL